MILRRIGEAVRRQDWFVVLVEVLVVVFGVFIGLQVDDWNQARKDRAHERVVLERLLEEAENAVAYLDRFIRQRADDNKAREAMIAFLSDPERFPMDEAGAAAALMALTHYQAMTPATAVYDELSAPGDLQLIRSRLVREALALYVAEISSHNSHLDYFRASADQIFEISLPYVSAEYDPEPGNFTRRTVAVDWPSFRADKRAVFIAIDSLRNQLVFQALAREPVLERARIMCEAIAEDIGRECTPVLAAEPKGGNR